MDKLLYEGLIEKAIIASKSMPDCIETKGFFKWQIVDGKILRMRYDRLEVFTSNTYVSQKRADIFLINELDENKVFYAIHATFVGTFRYKFKLKSDGSVILVKDKLVLIR